MTKIVYVIYSRDGYYTGSKYTYHGEKFAVFDSDINKAKKYKILTMAVKGQIALKINCVNCGSFMGNYVYIKKIEINESGE